MRKQKAASFQNKLNKSGNTDAVTMLDGLMSTIVDAKAIVNKWPETLSNLGEVDWDLLDPEDYAKLSELLGEFANTLRLVTDSVSASRERW
jgi:hypothetical protein